MTFTWSLVAPTEPVEGPDWATFAEDHEDWEDDYPSQVMVGCEFLEQHGFAFGIQGFGRGAWPVDVGYDLSTILEEMPSTLADLDAGRPTVVDMYAPGTETRITFEPDGDDVVLMCASVLWDRAPAGIRMPRAKAMVLFHRLLLEFSDALLHTGSPIAAMEPFLGWRRPIDADIEGNLVPNTSLTHLTTARDKLVEIAESCPTHEWQDFRITGQTLSMLLGWPKDTADVLPSALWLPADPDDEPTMVQELGASWSTYRWGGLRTWMTRSEGAATGFAARYGGLWHDTVAERSFTTLSPAALPR